MNCICYPRECIQWHYQNTKPWLKREKQKINAWAAWSRNNLLICVLTQRGVCALFVLFSFFSFVFIHFFSF